MHIIFPFQVGSVATAFVVALSLLASSGFLHGHGEIGDDIQDLQSHLEEYEEDLRKVMSKYDGVVQTYEEKGGEGLDTEQLLTFWEDAKIHYAIELNYIPIYVKIWQSIYAIKEGIETGKSGGEVEGSQETLEATLWQALGAVKMAAMVQKSKAAEGAIETKIKEVESSPVATLAQVKDKLDRVMAKCAERDYEAAMEMLHDTYLNLFEGVEGMLIEKDADLVVDLEKDFNVTLPKQIEAEASLDEIKKSTAAMKEKLDKASKLLADAKKDEKKVF